uniref:Uncharacterized protein n=1 Tax=Periophthalmus magnuspinnatus TaxID=409849 RepID=A0A3B4A2Z0_9GOBI
MIFQTLFEYLNVWGWCILFFVILILVDLVKNGRWQNFPPGPPGVPFLGNIFTRLDFKSINKLAEEYGPIFSLRRGSEKMVFISGYKMVRESLVNQLDSFTNRPEVPLFHVIFKGLGIALSNGYLWKKQRRFPSTHLRYFGEGQRTLEKYIEQECNYILSHTNAVGNIISSVVFGHRFEYTDDRFQKILQLDSEAILLAGSPIAQLYDVFPGVMKYLPGPHQKVHKNYFQILDFLMQEIKKHQENVNLDDPRDYIDVYLGEMEKRKEDALAGFNLDTLLVCTLDLVEAGTETAATTLRWAVVLMLKYPEIQAKVQAEIDTVVGQSRQPTLTDRPNMPYTDAVIHEVQRFGNIVPLGFPKMASKDTTLGGYFIPKGTVTASNLSSVLFDKNEWETPDVFNPGHFLDAEGHFRKRDAFLPFSAGKRMCLGEHLAKMQLFLFFSSMLQRFTLTAPPGEMPSLVGVQGFTNSPEQFRMMAVPR